MSSLRLALKQSLEETSATTSPPPPPPPPQQQQQQQQQQHPPAVQGISMVGRTSPHHASAAGSSGATHSQQGIATGSGSVTSYQTEEDSISTGQKKRGPGRPRKHNRPSGEKTKKRGRPKKNHPANGDEDAFSSENEFSVGEGTEAEYNREDVHHRVSAAAKIQSRWKKSKGKHSVLEGFEIADPSGGTTGGTKTDAQYPSQNDSGNPDASTAATINQSKPVTPPTLELIEYMRSMPQKRARKAVHPGLRVKVRFVTNNRVKKDGKVVRKRIWYGGRITAVSKEGSKIKIKYDDKTSEVTQFPDKDVVIDDSFNGKHQARADRFIPPAVDTMDGDGEGEEFSGEGPEDEEDQHHATKPTRTKDTHHDMEESKLEEECATAVLLSSSKPISTEVAQSKGAAVSKVDHTPDKPEGGLKSINHSSSEMPTKNLEHKDNSDNLPTNDSHTQPEKILHDIGKQSDKESVPLFESRETSIPAEAAKDDNDSTPSKTKPLVEDQPAQHPDAYVRSREVPPSTSADSIGGVSAPTESLPAPAERGTEPPEEIPEKADHEVTEDTIPQSNSIPSVDSFKPKTTQSSPTDVSAEKMETKPAEMCTAQSRLPERPAEPNGDTQSMENATEAKLISQVPAQTTRAPVSETNMPEISKQTPTDTADVPKEESSSAEPNESNIPPSDAAMQSLPSSEKPTLENSPNETIAVQKSSEQAAVPELEYGSSTNSLPETSPTTQEKSMESGKVSELKESESDGHKKPPDTEVPEPVNDVIAESKPAESKELQPGESIDDTGSKHSSSMEEAPTRRLPDAPEQSGAGNFKPASSAEVDSRVMETSEEPAKPKRKRGRPPKHRPSAEVSSQDKINVKENEGVPSPPAPASSMESEMSLDTSEKSDPKDRKSVKSNDSKGATKQTLTIRIPNLKKTSTKKADKESELTGDTAGVGVSESPRGKKRSTSSVEGEEPPAKRLHIHIGSKGPQESLTDQGDMSEKITGTDTVSKGVDVTPTRDAALSPRPKKVKRKREREIDSTPRIAASKPGKSYVEKSDAKAELPGGNSSVQEISEQKSSGSGDDGNGTLDGRTKFDSQSAARLGRKAAQQANERISSKNDLPPDLAAKKKKKKRRDMDEAEAGRDVEIPAFQWVQCDKCAKWRIIPSSVVESLPPLWYCANNKWDAKRASCDAPEQTPKQVAKERKRKKRKLMMEREAAEAAERGVAPGVEAPQMSTSPRNSDDAVDTLRASPSEHSFDSGHGTDGQKEKKGIISSKKPKNPSVVEVSLQVDEEPKPRGRGRPRRNPPKEASTPSVPSNSAPPTTDEADNLEWVQCEKCDKWRKLPPHISADELPDVWYCSMNTWNPGSASCSAPEDKADGLQDIFNNNATSGKLSYRNLIFGSNGRKHNRPISERTRAAESLFAAVSDDSDTPSAVMYANSSAFVCRGKLNSQSDENDAPTVLDLMASSHLWAELRKCQPKSAVPLMFDELSTQSRESMKDIVLHCLGDQTLTGEQLHERVRDRDWESAPLGWTAVRKYCSENMIVMAMCDLVKMGILECFRVDGPFPNGQLWTLCYRRATAHGGVSTAGAAVSPDTANLSSDTGSPRRCMKFAKPWKRAQHAQS